MNQIDNETREDQVPTKRERIDLEREEKQKRKEQEIRVKKIKKMVPWLVFILVVIGGVYWASIASEKTTASRPGEEIPILSREHINVGDLHEPYNSNPPTSGPHAGPASWGFSEQELADENAIHNLEHGGIWISYKNLDDDSIATLREIAQQNSLSVVVSPREANDTNIAVASWGRLLKLDVVDEPLITEFIRLNKNKSPEPLAR